MVGPQPAAAEGLDQQLSIPVSLSHSLVPLLAGWDFSCLRLSQKASWPSGWVMGFIMACDLYHGWISLH